MNTVHPTLRPHSKHLAIVSLLLLIALLGACNNAATPAPATPLPPTNTPLPPTATPFPPTATPSPLPPTPTPTPAPNLPAPLYYLGASGQVMRLDEDGGGPTAVTSAPDPVTDFDVSTTTGQLAYVSGNDLYLTDDRGGNPTLLLDGPDIPADDTVRAERIHALHFSPQGQRLAFALGGVQTIRLDDGSTQIVQADDEPGPGAGTYFPNSWSPDGSRLLITRAFYTTTGALQINSLDFDSIVQLSSACCHPAWSVSGQYVYVADPYYGPHHTPGLRRYTAWDGSEEALVAMMPGSDTLPLVAWAQPAPQERLLSFQATVSTAEYNAAAGAVPLQMVSTDLDGVSNRVVLHSNAYILQEVLWAPGGQGAVVVSQPSPAGTPPTSLWLYTDQRPAAPLAISLPADGPILLRWGATAAALEMNQLRQQFVSDTGIILAPEGEDLGFGPVAILPLQDTAPPLWAVYTTGIRAFGSEHGFLPHILAIYTRNDDGWQLLTQTLLADPDNPNDPGADYLNEGGVEQVTVVPGEVWLQIHAGVGAHSGVYRLLRFADNQLETEATGFSASPGAGNVADLNQDGIGEVLLDATDYYVFCYACGVRYPHTQVLQWDGSTMTLLSLQRLDATAPAELRTLNDKIVTLAEAGLWKDALALLPDLEEANAQTADETVAWNIILVRLNGEEKEEPLQETELIFPILQYLFFGDYEAAVAPFRDYTPDQIFSPESPLLADSPAKGWEESIQQWIFKLSDTALDVMEKDSDIAAAYFLRAWAAYLVDPADPAIIENLDQAVQFSPDDALYTDSLAFLQAPNAEATPSNSSFITQEDGSTLFFDKDSGYQMTIPADWIVIPLEEGDYESLLQLGSGVMDVDQNLIDMLLSQAKSTNAQFMAWNFDPATFSEASVPTIALIKQELPGEVPTEFVLKTSAQSMPQLLPGAKVLSSEMIENAQGVSLGVIELLLPTSDKTDGAIIYEQLALLVKNTTMFNLTTAVNSEFRDTLEPVFDQVIDSITLSP